MSWRVAKSLLALRAQVNSMAPNRSKASDGSIGDTSHASTGSASDHNPWVHDSNGQSVVTAIDITHDPAHGCDVTKIAAAIIASKDPRVKYMIHNGRIVSDYQVGRTAAWVWRSRGLSNDHVHHLHISVDARQAAFDGVGKWSVGSKSPLQSSVGPVGQPTASWSAKVKALQTAVHVTADGAWGDRTNLALGAVRYFAGSNRLPWGVKALQRSVGVLQDGALGAKTRAATVSTVMHIQSALGAAADGSWGPKTEAAFLVAYTANYHKA